MFESVLNYIESNKAQDAICADSYLELLNLVTADTLVFNAQKRISEMAVIDSKTFLLNLNAVMSLLAELGKENKPLIEEFTVKQAELFQTTKQEFDTSCTAFHLVISKIEALEGQQKKLQEQNERLTKERGHLLSLAKVNEDLQSGIDILCDLHLDELDAQNSKLKSELSERTKHKDILLQQTRALEIDIDQLKKTIDELQPKLDSLEEQVKIEEGNKTKIVKTIDEKTIWLKELECWIHESPEKLGRIEQQYTALRDKAHILTSVWESMNSQESTQSPTCSVVFDALIGKREHFTGIDIKLNERCETIQQSLGELQNWLKELIEASEKLSEETKK